ncbi:MAG: alpha/beta hydrolase [Chloroflexi bacterium]|nr:alpha/beta hydrolase [Chloroflexota bacterium]
MPTLTLNQESIFYAHHTSSPARHNILLLHGAGGSHLVWPAALRRLPDATVYALDLPGHGRSTGTGYAQISEYAAVVSQFIEALGLTDVVLVGHSMGGAVAQTLALHPPPEVAALILVGTGAKLRVAPAILAQILPDFEQAVTTINQFAWSAAAPPQMVVRGQ